MAWEDVAHDMSMVKTHVVGYILPSETPYVLRWPLMSLEHSEILTHKSPLGSTKPAPQSPPTYLENSHEAILASGALQATQYIKTEY